MRASFHVLVLIDVLLSGSLLVCNIYHFSCGQDLSWTTGSRFLKLCMYMDYQTLYEYGLSRSKIQGEGRNDCAVFMHNLTYVYQNPSIFTRSFLQIQFCWVALDCLIERSARNRHNEAIFFWKKGYCLTWYSLNLIHW